MEKLLAVRSLRHTSSMTNEWPRFPLREMFVRHTIFFVAHAQMRRRKPRGRQCGETCSTKQCVGTRSPVSSSYAVICLNEFHSNRMFSKTTNTRRLIVNNWNHTMCGTAPNSCTIDFVTKSSWAHHRHNLAVAELPMMIMSCLCCVRVHEFATDERAQINAFG